jgi:hypothetical protein
MQNTSVVERILFGTEFEKATSKMKILRMITWIVTKTIIMH